MNEICCLDYTSDRMSDQVPVTGSFQDNTFVYGLAKGLGCKIGIKSAWGAGWSEPSPIVMQHLMLIRALQFKLDRLTVCLWARPPALIDISKHRKLIERYASKQTEKPVFNLVVYLKYKDNWNYMQFSSEAICSGALLGGYNLKATKNVDPDADAYYILTRGYVGTETLDLPHEIVTLFETTKPVFLQCIGYIPSAERLTPNWTSVLEKVGLDTKVSYGMDCLPEAGIYKGVKHRYGGFNYYSKRIINHGTIIHESAVIGKIFSKSNATPFLVGRGDKYLFTGSCINYENSFLISNLLSDTIQRPSDVFGVVGEKVSAFFALSNTDIEINLPTESSRIRVLRYDGEGSKVQDEDIAYNPPYTTSLSEDDLLIIGTL